jgi:hypothetical protein
MLEGGENPLYIARRLIRFASEDIGMADSHALQVAVAASGKNHGADHAIFQLQIDFGGTDAGRRIGICHLTSLLYIGFMDVSAREGW